MYELDLLRLAAAVMVVIGHYFGSRGSENRYSLAYGAIFNYGDTVERWAALGPLGVEVFFTISGFVIALSAEGRSARQFMASRLSRILPAFWFCCLLTWLVIKLDPGYRTVSVPQLFANLFFVARPLKFEFIDQVYWTLVIEMRFYLLVAVFILAFGFKRFHWFLIGWFSAVLLDLFGLLPPALRFALMPQYGQNFIAGGALYLLGTRRHTMLAAALLVGSTGLAVLRAQEHIATVRADLNVATAVVMLAATVVLWLAASRRSAFMGRPWMAVAGALTYPLYLLHEDLGFMVMRHFSGFNDPWAISVLTMLGFMLAAYVVYRLVEQPLAPRIRRLVAGTPGRGRQIAVGEPSQ